MKPICWWSSTGLLLKYLDFTNYSHFAVICTAITLIGTGGHYGASGEFVAKNILKFTVTGVVVGVVMGWLLSLVSGNIFVVLMIGTIGLFVGVILGIVHRNDA